MPHIRYRSDIDGLRALAILPVIAFHIGFSWFRGGFVGVDIFFVISGYLIGRGIVEDLDHDRFSIATFYERRIRRIVPALIVMLAVTSAACVLLLVPNFLEDYAKSLVSAVASVSNIWFWQSTSYFGGPADSKPLLHTWSLAVEEQYYLIMPLLLTAVYRYFRSRLLLIVWTLTIVSFAISAYGAFQFPTATFYLLHTRAWELLAGLLVFLQPLPLLHKHRNREILGWGSIGVITLYVFVYSGRLPFPGIAALPPVAAAAALIAIGGAGGSSANQFLSWRPLVWVGLISYSLYLWHWPVIVLFKLGLQQSVEGSAVKFALLGVSFGLAWLSWRYVERPFRTVRHRTRRTTFVAATAVGIALASAAGAIVVDQGIPSRYSASQQKMLAWMEYSSDTAFRDGTCFLDSDDLKNSFALSICSASPPNRPNVLLIGDSQAAHLYYGLAQHFGGSNIWQITAAGCRPTQDDWIDSKVRCKAMHKILPILLAQHKPDLILIAGHWHAGDLRDLEKWIDQLKLFGVRIVISGPIPDYTLPLPVLLARSASDPVVSLAAYLRPDLASLDGAIRRLAEREKIGFVSMADHLCAHGRWPCRTMASATAPMVFDGGHLTPAGSIVISQILEGSDPSLLRSSTTSPMR